MFIGLDEVKIKEIVLVRFRGVIIKNVVWVVFLRGYQVFGLFLLGWVLDDVFVIVVKFEDEFFDFGYEFFGIFQVFVVIKQCFDKFDI